MASWLDDLLGKEIRLNNGALPMRKKLNFVQGVGATVSVADNPTLGTTDVTIDGGAGSSAVVVDTNLTQADNGRRYYKTVAGDIVLYLPAAPAVGTTYHVRECAALGFLTVQANTGQTIQMSTAIGAAAGYVRESSSPGASLTIECYAANKWLVTSSIGPWELA